MKFKFSKTLLACALAAGCSMAAHAANLVEISGTDADFFYDADFWGLGSASVTGNTISFATSPAYFSQVSVATPLGYRSETYSDAGMSSIYVVARSGHALSGELVAGVTGTYAISPQDSSSIVRSDGAIFLASRTGGAFARGDYLGYYAAQAQQFSDVGHASAGAFGTTGGSVLYNPPGRYGALVLDGSLTLSATETGAGTTSTRLDGVSYAFAVRAVPEPEQYALFLLGAATLLAVRRRPG